MTGRAAETCRVAELRPIFEIVTSKSSNCACRAIARRRGRRRRHQPRPAETGSISSPASRRSRSAASCRARICRPPTPTHARPARRHRACPSCCRRRARTAGPPKSRRFGPTKQGDDTPSAAPPFAARDQRRRAPRPPALERVLGALGENPHRPAAHQTRVPGEIFGELVGAQRSAAGAISRARR